MEDYSNLFTILTFPNKKLRMFSDPVEGLSEETIVFCDTLCKFFNTTGGVGIAAPQVGRKERIIIVKLSFYNNPIVLINPIIKFINLGKNLIYYDYEGCLSVPNRTELIPRHREIVISFKTIDNTENDLKLEDFDARVVQHEIDHLDGKLMLDRLNSFPRDKINRLM